MIRWKERFFIERYLDEFSIVHTLVIFWWNRGRMKCKVCLLGRKVFESVNWNDKGIVVAGN